MWGPFRVRGVYGVLINASACMYTAVVSIFSFWPPVLPVTVKNMNYSILVTGAVVIFSVLWYFFSAKKEYTGPVIEVTERVWY